MDSSIFLGIAALATWLVTVYLRIPPSVLFLSILVGKLFSDELSSELYSFTIKFMPNIDGKYVQLFLLVIPVILTILFLKGTTPKSKMLFNALPLFFCLVTLALFINPYINVVNNLDEPQRILLTENQSYVIAVSALITLISAWAPHMKVPLKGKKHKG